VDDLSIQKGIAMEDTFITWLKATKGATYRVKIVTRERNADATYTYEEALEMEQSILRIVQKSWVGSITLTAPCGCSYRFEKTEHHPEFFCDTYWVRAVFNGDVDE
jgi:hypothetical protein